MIHPILKNIYFEYSAESRTENYSAIREIWVRDFIAPANGLAAPVIAYGFGLRPRA